MNKKAVARWWFVIPAALVAYGASWSPSLADEPAANDPNQVQIDTLEPVLFLNRNVSRDVLSLFVAANSDWMGAEVAQVDDVLRSHLGLGEGKGLVVTSVADDGPAAKAGIQKNDVLVTVGNEEIAGPDALRKSLEASAEKPIAIGFIRGGKKQSVEVTPKSTTATIALSTTGEVIAEPKYWLGLGLAGADDTLRAQLALPAGEGLVVTNVENESPAAKAGVMTNDVLLKLDGKGLTTIEALSEQLQTIADKSVSLELLRRGKPAMLTVTAEKHVDEWQAVMLTSNVNDVIVRSYMGALDVDALTFTYSQAKPDLVQQISDLEAQVKQLEASLAALRAAIEPPTQPAQTGGEKKDGK